jgi:hypothetical protein
MYVQRLLLWSSYLYLNENRAKQKHDFPWRGQERSPACKSVGLVLGAASSSSGGRVAPPLSPSHDFLALQLPFFEMGALSDRLVNSAPV